MGLVVLFWGDGNSDSVYDTVGVAISTLMAWYLCKAVGCGSAVEVRNVLRRAQPPTNSERPFLCMDCGEPVTFVLDTEEQWWLSMEAAYNLPRPLIKQLIDLWHEDLGARGVGSFDDWLINFQKETR